MTFMDTTVLFFRQSAHATLTPYKQRGHHSDGDHPIYFASLRRKYHHSYVDKTEVRRGKETCPRAHSSVFSSQYIYHSTKFKRNNILFYQLGLCLTVCERKAPNNCGLMTPGSSILYETNAQNSYGSS